MSRWEHTVVVKADIRLIPYLSCSCGWISEGMWDPAVTRLAEVAQDHRRAASAASKQLCPRCQNDPTPLMQAQRSDGVVLLCSCGYSIPLVESSDA